MSARSRIVADFLGVQTAADEAGDQGQRRLALRPPSWTLGRLWRCQGCGGHLLEVRQHGRRDWELWAAEDCRSNCSHEQKEVDRGN